MLESFRPKQTERVADKLSDHQPVIKLLLSTSDKPLINQFNNQLSTSHQAGCNQADINDGSKQLEISAHAIENRASSWMEENHPGHVGQTKAGNGRRSPAVISGSVGSWAGYLVNRDPVEMNGFLRFLFQAIHSC